MAFLVEIGLNNPSSGASTYDVYISDFTNTYPYTGWIQVVAGIDYNQFPVIVNTDDSPEVHDNIKYKKIFNYCLSFHDRLKTLHKTKCKYFH